MTRFERSAAALFILITLGQAALGVWRARMMHSSVQPALALAALFAVTGALWLAKRFTRFPALLSATIGVLSAISAFNAPLIGTVARISIPLMAFAIAAVLVTASAPRRLQLATLLLYAVAFVVLEFDLHRDARWQSRSWIESRAGGSPWNTKSSAT